VGANDFVQTNISGTHTLLQAAKKFKIKKFIQISTDEVYGSIESGSFREDSLLKPSNPYSASKASADMLVKSFNTTYGLPTIITRSTNNFGPFQYPEKVIPLFVTNLLEGKKVPVYGDGLNIRDWLYVTDNCEAIDFLLHHGKEGQIYNISSNNERTNLELTKKILNFLEKDETYIEYVTDRLGHDRRYSLDCTKIKKLGWKPKFEFNEALEMTVNWYKDNKWWWQPLKGKEAHGL
jgi:dTDP-glucose 4,6-dehydratase